jgi:hypothetical protein
MLSEPRAIFFETVLEWPPFEVTQFRVTQSVARDVYNRLFHVDFPHEAYKNLDLQADDLTLSTKVEGDGYSKCRFGSASIAFEESNPNVTADMFAAKVGAVLKEYAAACKAANLQPPPVFFQKCRIRCLSQPGFHESLNLLAGKIGHVIDRTVVFGRPPQYFGVRFRFPPVRMETDSGEPEEHENFSVIRFETYSDDPKQIWMEIAATHFFRQPIDVCEEGELRHISDRVSSSYKFLTDKCIAFLNQFDVPEQPDGGEQSNANDH